MAAVELVMPKMGESIIEATILSWSKDVGEAVAEEETVVEIATDKVDSEVPSPVAGVVAEIRFRADEVVPVGEVLAIIETDGATAQNGAAAGGHAAAGSHGGTGAATAEQVLAAVSGPGATPASAELATSAESPAPAESADAPARTGTGGQFFSPLVRRIAEEEGITADELASIDGSGRSGRVNKADVLAYLERRGGAAALAPPGTASATAPLATPPPAAGGGVEVVEMDRMRRLIAAHMVRSKQVSPHVTSFVEADVTELVRWRDANKAAFLERHGQRLTFTPLIVEAITRAIAEFPMVNVEVRDTQILVKRDVNVGIATALPSGNLIVPVIRGADRLNLAGLAARTNDLVARARAGDLRPADTQDGTFTMTNIGTFGNLMGTPIINQPQAAILAAGAIKKRPAVLETAHGDVIAIRHQMYLSMSYDHRVVDGMLGGSFLRRVGDLLEGFDTKRTV